MKPLPNPLWARSWLVLLLVLLVSAKSGRAEPFAVLCTDRTAIEQVYYQHRLGTKPPFEQASPATLIEQLVRQDLRKEAALMQNYGVTITPEQVGTEVQRINTTTRAPEVLAEIKAALGNDPGRFARAFARPLVVERLLRARFENDDTLHAAQRHEAELARGRLLAGQPVGNLQDATWQLTPRPAEDAAATPAPSPVPTKAIVQSGSYSIEATGQLSQVIAAPDHPAPGTEKFYFEDLDPELQKVLRVQLQKPGDVSAVIETPGGFLVFLAREKTAATLHVASLSIPKRSYETWLARQLEKKI